MGLHLLVIKIAIGVYLSVGGGILVVAPMKRKKLTLKQLLAKVTKNNLHAEIDSDPCLAPLPLLSAIFWLDTANAGELGSDHNRPHGGKCHG